MDESEEEEADPDDTPPDNMAEQTMAAKAASTREEVRKVFHWDEIVEHKQQLRENAYESEKSYHPELERVEVPCNWAKVSICSMAKHALPRPCCETGCPLTVHPVCQ